MAAKSWETDFRSAAISASIKKLQGKVPADLFQKRESFCLPVAERPIVGFSPGKVTLIALVLGFALLGGAVWVGSLADRGGDKPDSPLVMSLALLMSVSGIVTFFLPLLFLRQVLSFFIGSRASELRQRSRDGTLLAAEISDADKSAMKISVDGDDHVLVWPDRAGRRVIMEGVAARYHICEEDVLEIKQFEYMNYIGADVTYRIDDQTVLRLAIARVSILLEITRQLPLLRFLRKRIRNQLHEEITACLGGSG